MCFVSSFRALVIVFYFKFIETLQKLMTFLLIRNIIIIMNSPLKSEHICHYLLVCILKQINLKELSNFFSKKSNFERCPFKLNYRHTSANNLLI